MVLESPTEGIATMYSNYTDIAQKIANRETFEGNSSHGVRDSTGGYRVYSYTTEILTIDPFDHILRFDNRYYSNTTSKLQGIIRRAYPLATGAYECNDRVVFDNY